MPPSGSSQHRRQYKNISEVFFDSSESFDVQDYLQNPPLIRRLYEEKLVAQRTGLYFEQQLKETEIKLKDAENQLTPIQTQLQVLKSDLAHEREKGSEKDRESIIIAIIQSVLVILGTTLVGLGASWITSASNSQSGWVSIVFGVIVQLASITVFFLPRLRGTRTNGQHKDTPVAK